MRLGLLLLCFCLLLGSAAVAESDDLFAWTLSIGADKLTSPAAMATASDGGVFIAGSTDSEESPFGASLGGLDGFVVRMNEDGDILWHRRLGGSADDVFTHVVETHDGGCVAMGATLSSDGDARASRGGMDAWVVRLSETGETLWSKCLGGSADDELLYLQLTEDGNYFACGHTKSRNGDLGANFGGWDAWAVLLQPEDGKPLDNWPYRYGGVGDDVFTYALPIHEGWLLIGESAEDTNTLDADGNPVYTNRPIVQILSVDGTATWETPLSLGETGENTLVSVVEGETGWMLSGMTNSRSSLMPAPHGGMDNWVLNLRQSASVYRQWTFGGSRDETLQSIHRLSTGGYLLLGTTASNDGQVFGNHGGVDTWIVSISSTGALQWQQTIGGSNESLPAGILFREDGGFLIAGTTTAQDGDIGRHTTVRTGYLASLAPNGNLQSVSTIGLSGECALLSLRAGENAAYLLGVLRSVNTEGPVESVWIARLAEEGYLEE